MRLLSFSTVAAVAAAALAIRSSRAAPISGPVAPRGVAPGAKIRGVNLGGWFIIECWMKPRICDPYGAVDQWTLMEALGDEGSKRSILEDHWNTWFTESDFQQIAAAGLNIVRLPIPHWSVNASGFEPYFPYAEQPYISKALDWARKYNLDVLLDVHTTPRSVNGFDVGGRKGPIGFMKDHPAENLARVKSMTQKILDLWIKDPRYGGVVKGLALFNEPVLTTPDLTQSYMEGIYDQLYAMVRPQAPGLQLVFHDSFLQPMASHWANWVHAGLKTGVMLDTHRYQAFEPQKNFAFDKHISYTCGLRAEFDELSRANVPLVVGEMSLGYGCTSCSYNNIGDSIKAQSDRAHNLFLRRFWEAQNMLYEEHSLGWMFWNWHTETYAEWSYKDALHQGWIPANPGERVFVPDANGCPTTNLKPGVTLKFAVESNSMASSNGVDAQRVSGAQDVQQIVANAQGPVNVTIESIGQTIEVNAFPSIKQTTFGEGFNPTH